VTTGASNASNPPAVRPVESPEDLERFVRLPWRLYCNDPCWVPPLLSRRRAQWSPKTNAFLRHSAAQPYLAERAGQVVGRIAAIHYTKHIDTYHDGTGFFGFFESVDDQSVADALFDTAAGWLRSRGLTRMRGPTDFSMNEEYGLLVDGFDVPPVVLHTHHLPYYKRLVESSGFEVSQEMYAYRMFRPERLPERMERSLGMVERHGVSIRKLDMRNFDADVDRIHGIYSLAWAENWGAVPLTKDDMHQIAAELRQIADPDLVVLALLNGETIGCSVTIPDINQALKGANGRLFPVGWAKVLWTQRHLAAVRVLIAGVLKPYRNRGIEGAMFFKTFQIAMTKGYQWADMSLINETNKATLNVAERAGGHVYKTFRMYDKPL
jgi:hypothetical protein